MSQDYFMVTANVIMALAAIGSLIVTVVLTYRSLRDQRKLQAKVVNNETLLLAREMLYQMPEALRLDGITEADFAELSKAGITKEEAVYLFISFKAGAQLHEIAKREIITPYREGDYRYQMMSVPETRKAWTILRKALSDSGFKDRMNATAELFDEISQSEQGE